MVHLVALMVLPNTHHTNQAPTFNMLHIVSVVNHFHLYHQVVNPVDIHPEVATHQEAVTL